MNSLRTITYYQEVFRQALENEALSDQPPELYDPIKYILSIGGKRIRPTILLMTCDMFGGSIQEAIPAALAIEMFHNFTLVHDDIMDKAPIRRGKETVYKKWNTNIAILAGDTMMPLSYDFILQLDERKLKEVLRLFNHTAKQVCEGQQFDLNFETQNDVSIDQYLHMIQLKTAVLIGASLKIGAQLADASLTDQENIYNFGLNLGMAFQLRDDYLDVFGDENVFGKKTGGDIASNKKTYLFLKAHELAESVQREELTLAFSTELENSNEKIATVISIYNQLNIKDYSEKLINTYFDKSIKFLENISVGPERKKELKILANGIVNRNY